MKKLYLLLFTSLFVVRSFAGIITSTGTGGNWSATSTWVGGVAPAAGDDVIIANGATVTIDASVNCTNLTVGQGTSGILQYNTTASARTLTVSGNMIINAGAIVRPGASGGFANSLTIAGNLTNNGTLTTAITTNYINLVFNGTVTSQTFTNTGTITSNGLRSLTINNTAGTVTIPSALSIASGATLTLTAGTLLVGAGGTGSITLGSAASGTFTCVRTNGSMVAASATYGAGVTTKTYTYNGTGTITTGIELTAAASITIDVLSINNSTLNLILNKAINVNSALALSNGIVNTTATNLLSLGTATAAGILTGGSATAFINGPFARTFAAQVAAESYNAATLFPVGKSGIYMPVYLDPNIITGTVQLKAEAFASNTGTNASGFLANKRWDILQTTGGVNLTNVYLRVVDATVAANYSLLKSSTASGAYTGVSTGTATVAGASLTSLRSIPVNELSSNTSYSFGVDNSFTAPGGVQGAVMWFKADAGTTVSAGKVTNWANQTPFITNIGNLSKQGTGNIFYDASKINYNPSFGFDGTQYLASGGTDDIPYTVLVNGKRASSYCVALAPTASGWASFYGYQAIPSVTNKVACENGNGIFQGTSATGFANFPTAGNNLPAIYSFVKGSTSNTAFLNGLSGTPVTTGLTVYSTPITFGTFNIMGFKNAGGSIGDLQEIIFFDGTSSATEKTKIESYLAIKYGITINNSAGGSAGDLLLSDGSMAWDASDNAGYHKQVIGLAKDNISALLQKQSHTTDDSLRVFTGSLAASNQTNTGNITNDLSSLIIGNDGGGPQWSTSVTKPASINSRLVRTFKVTNTNFSDNFSVEIKCDTIGGLYSLGNLRFLVSATPDFSAATVYAAPDVTFAFGSIIVNGISNSLIPANTTRYVTVGLSLTILPVELTAFNATAVHNKEVVLNWKISTTNNNPYFTVQKSADGKTWVNLTTVKGNANQTDFSVTDTDPFTSVSYYRLQQTTGNNEYRYSDIKKVSLRVNVTLHIYPNPVLSQVLIEGTTTELSQLKLFSVTGQDISGQIQVISRNSSKIVVDLSRLSKGIYMMKTNTTVTKLFKQ